MVAVFACLTGAAACSPNLQSLGPTVTEPRLDIFPPQAGDFYDGQVIAADGISLPLQRWPDDVTVDGETSIDPAAIILALHGFTEYSNAFAVSAPAWAARGILTYAYDQRGFGEAGRFQLWAGAQTYVDDATTALSLIRRQHPGVPVFLLGHSMGGSVSILTATGASADARPDGLILVAPATLGRPALRPSERRFLNLVQNMVPWAQSGGRGITKPPTDNIEMLRAMGRDPRIQREIRVDQGTGLIFLLDAASQAVSRIDTPSLLLLGGNDEIIPGSSEAFLREALSKQIESGLVDVRRYDDGFHMLLRDLDAAPRRIDIAEWVLKQAAHNEPEN